METSPHTRGERTFGAAVRPLRRNIPSYAGRTRQCHRQSRMCEKHPRIRGENDIRQPLTQVISETSPHTRGEHRFGSDVSKASRNIPAYAGRTCWIPKSEEESRNHPRIRGENSLHVGWVCSAAETSPHTRGERLASMHHALAFGNISAYAGRTHKGFDERGRCRKHPRIRGENKGCSNASRLRAETSPHTRGELCFEGRHGNSVGNIPAYAGRTRSKRLTTTHAQKHPRIRGENMSRR